MNAGGFSPRAVLAMVVFGLIAFIAMLWMIGAGMADRQPDAAGAHGAGKGLGGYGALSDYLERRGWQVGTVRSTGGLSQEGVLVLTPQHYSNPEEIAAVVEKHRRAGPTVVIVPKWQMAKLPPTVIPKRDGWVELRTGTSPNWPGFHDEIGLDLKPMPGGAWLGGGLTGTLPQANRVASGRNTGTMHGALPLVPLVVGRDDGRMLAGYIADGNDHPALRQIAVRAEPELSEDVYDSADGLQPLIFVFEPDLFNNYGFSRVENALLAERIIGAAAGGGKRRLLFDLTLPGYARSDNLLTLAFTPPFLAATLCLILAAAVLVWRSINRFGPPLTSGRAIGFGKRALVSSAAGLVRRARRLHLVGPPYADAARERLVRALALPQRIDAGAAEAAIDRALAARDPSALTFSQAAAAMRRARRPADLLRAAQNLHSLERILKR